MEVDTGANSVILEPTFALARGRTDPKDLVLVGEVKSVDVVSSMFEMELQTLRGLRITDVTVTTAEATFQVDGVAYEQADGMRRSRRRVPGPGSSATAPPTRVSSVSKPRTWRPVSARTTADPTSWRAT